MILSPRFRLFKGLSVISQLIIGTQCNRDLTLEMNVLLEYKLLQVKNMQRRER